MLPAWQTATFRQLLGMLVIFSFLSPGLGQGESLTPIVSPHSLGTAHDTWVLAMGRAILQSDCIPKLQRPI